MKNPDGLKMPQMPSMKKDKNGKSIFDTKGKETLSGKYSGKKPPTMKRDKDGKISFEFGDKSTPSKNTGDGKSGKGFNNLKNKGQGKGNEKLNFKGKGGPFGSLGKKKDDL